jgi:chromosome segregation ATPase
MPGQSAASDGAHKFKATLSPILSPRAAPVPVSSRGTWCAKCQSRAHWTFECFQKSERACLQEQLSYAIAACETRQVALRQRQEDVAAQRDLHAVEMQIARNEQATLAARVEELEQHLIGVLKDESRLIDQTDKLRSELNDARNSLKACTARCEQMHQEILAAHEDKARAVASATEAAAQRAVIAAQQADARIAQAKADADAETQRCLRDSAKRFAQDIADSQMQVNEYAKRIEALQESLAEKRRELKSMEKQLADAKAEVDGRVAEAVADAEAKVKMTIKGLKKQLSDANAVTAEYKQRCEELQASALRAQLDKQASEAAAVNAAARLQAAARNFEDELEAQRTLHSAEMQMAESEHAKLALQLYELQLASAR